MSAYLSFQNKISIKFDPYLLKKTELSYFVVEIAWEIVKKWSKWHFIKNHAYPTYKNTYLTPLCYIYMFIYTSHFTVHCAPCLYILNIVGGGDKIKIYLNFTAIRGLVKEVNCKQKL